MNEDSSLVCCAAPSDCFHEINRLLLSFPMLLLLETASWCRYIGECVCDVLLIKQSMSHKSAGARMLIINVLKFQANNKPTERGCF